MLEHNLIAYDKLARNFLSDDIDEHLANKIQNWELDERTVWGTIHVYLADSEA